MTTETNEISRLVQATRSEWWRFVGEDEQSRRPGSDRELNQSSSATATALDALNDERRTLEGLLRVLLDFCDALRGLKDVRAERLMGHLGRVQTGHGVPTDTAAERNMPDMVSFRGLCAIQNPGKPTPHRGFHHAVAKDVQLRVGFAAIPNLVNSTAGPMVVDVRFEHQRQKALCWNSNLRHPNAASANPPTPFRPQLHPPSRRLSPPFSRHANRLLAFGQPVTPIEMQMLVHLICFPNLVFTP
ncbi:hypothetical protein LZ30DRAFT_772474 [Colletotrichum cereale]|nr:hypothetical protein LZ30DRAFT_772474 [Colletotrichum cereale]